MKTEHLQPDTLDVLRRRRRNEYTAFPVKVQVTTHIESLCNDRMPHIQSKRVRLGRWAGVLGQARPCMSSAGQVCTFWGRRKRGNEYMAPSVKVQVTPSHALKPSVMICARRRSDSITDVSSCLYCSYDSLPSFGGFTISAMPSCTVS